MANLSRTAYTKQLIGKEPQHTRQSWGAVGQLNGRPAVLLYTWEDEIITEDGKQAVAVDAVNWSASFGRKERGFHLGLVKDGSHSGYLLMCQGESTETSRRLTGYVAHPFKLGEVFQKGDNLYAYFTY